MSYPPGWPQVGKMHFRLSEPRLGDLDLTCDNGYVVSAYDLGFPQIREVSVPNALDDGTFDVTRYYGARSITLDVVLKPHTGLDPTSPPIVWPGPGQTAAEAKLRDKLLAYLYPGVRPTLIFTEHQDDRVKQAMLRGAQGTVAVNRRNYNHLNLSWVAPRGAFLGWDRRCYSYRFSSATSDSQTQTIVNTGSAPAHWQATVSGESIRPRFILNGQNVLQLDYDSAVGDVVVIDSFTRTVTINGTQSGYKYVNDLTSWAQVPPGVSQLTIEQDTYTVEGYPFAYWQPPSPGVSTNGPTNWATPPGTTPPNNPPPSGQPPWAWTTKADPVTGVPGHLDVVFCYYDTFL